MSNSNVSPDLWPGITRSLLNTVYTTIATDLVSQVDRLPATRASEKAALTSHAAKALLARIALQQKEYNSGPPPWNGARYCAIRMYY